MEDHRCKETQYLNNIAMSHNMLRQCPLTKIFSRPPATSATVATYATNRLNVLDIPIVAHGTLTNNTTRQQSLLASLSAFPGSEILRIRGAPATPAILDAVSLALCLETRFWTLSLDTRFRRRESPEILAPLWIASWTVGQWRRVAGIASPVAEIQELERLNA